MQMKGTRLSALLSREQEMKAVWGRMFPGTYSVTRGRAEGGGGCPGRTKPLFSCVFAQILFSATASRIGTKPTLTASTRDS